jgi:hypothetical protein
LGKDPTTTNNDMSDDRLHTRSTTTPHRRLLPHLVVCCARAEVGCRAAMTLVAGLAAAAVLLQCSARSKAELSDTVV